jgi:hypothetical protein
MPLRTIAAKAVSSYSVYSANPFEKTLQKRKKKEKEKEKDKGKERKRKKKPKKGTLLYSGACQDMILSLNRLPS